MVKPAKAKQANPRYHTGRNLSTGKVGNTMPPQDTVVLRVVGKFQDQNICNTLHYNIEDQTSDNTTILESLCLAWIADIKGLWLARHSDAYRLTGVKAYRVDGEPKVPAFSLIGEAGGVTGVAVLSFAARVITMYTDSENHRRRGRVMLSGGEVNMFEADDGSVEAAEAGMMQVLGDLLVTPLILAGDTFRLCIPPTLQVPFELVVAALARTTPGVLRSRRVKKMYIG